MAGLARVAMAVAKIAVPEAGAYRLRSKVAKGWRERTRTVGLSRNVIMYR